MRPFLRVIKGAVLCLGLCAGAQAYAQTVTGYLSIKPSTAALGCGCTGCNDATTNASSTYPDPNGACGTTEPSGGSGSCTRMTKTRVIVIPAACTVTATGKMGDRSGCSGTTNGPGMDASDAFSIVGSGGTSNGTTGPQSGASNAQVTASMTQVGGQLTLSLTADRVAELLTYTVTYSGPSCLPSPLPIQLIYFSIDQQESEDMNVTWATATEHNTHHFEVEYSKDATAFRKALSIAASGESETTRIYQVAVPDTFRAELIYFRLKEVDKDGSFQYSPVIYLEHKTASDFMVMPNPTDNGRVSISSGVENNLSGSVEILDYTGKKIGEEMLQAPFTELDLNRYGKGLYLLRINTSRKTVTRRVIYN